MENILNIIGNYFFPMVLSVYLIYRIDRIMTEMVQNQKDFQNVVIDEIKDIKKDILEIRLDMAQNS